MKLGLKKIKSEIAAEIAAMADLRILRGEWIERRAARIATRTHERAEALVRSTRHRHGMTAA